MQASKIGFNTEYSEDMPTIEEVQSLHGEAMIEFGAPWCPHCQAAMTAVQEALSEPSFKSLLHIKIFDGKGKRLGRAFKVKRWPTLILLRDGQEIDRLIRPLQANDVRKFLQSSASSNS